MKFALVIAAIALLALAGVQADSNHRSKDGMARVMASSKTIVTVEPNLHRFCIPIGKTSIGGPKSVSLHVPRSLNGFEVKLDTSPLNSFISPTSANDKHCKKVSSLFLVRDSQDKSPFVFSQSEIAKAGAISGFIVGNKPSWISVRMTAGAFADVTGADDVCKSVLGVQSESAFENHDNDGHKSGHGHKSGRFSPRLLFILRKVMFLGASVALSFCIIGLLCKAIKKCRKPAATEEHNIEMGPVNEADESRDLALAIERSLADAEKKVVEVPQTAAPQFVFLPPQFMPAAGAPGATPYVPMFAPQFMNYSLQEDRN
jgi:hypothetical protein